MYAILGASGHSGAVVARTLLAAGKSVRVLVRDPARVAALASRGAEVITGDIEDLRALTETFATVKGAYVLLPPNPAATDLLAQSRRRADALREAVTAAKVPHIVLLSSVGAHIPNGTGPIATVHYAEERLGSIPGTLLTSIRASSFMENFSDLIHPMKTQGVLPVFSTHLEAPFSMVATQDIGETAAHALLEPPAQNDIIELVGPQAVSYAEAARIFSDAFGREVKAVTVPFDAVVPTLTSHGMGASMAGLMREMSEGFDAGRIGYDGKGRRVAGRMSLEEWARGVA